MALMLVTAGCGKQASPPEWKYGFWFWNGSSARAKASVPVDVLYYHWGTMDSPLVGEWAAEDLRDLPPAKELWLVVRYEGHGVPAPKAIAPMLQSLQRVQFYPDGRRRQLKIAGLQLDIDSPTRLLPEYAKFLGEVRKGLPPGFELSITALLDWFRDGTAINDVIAQVDEFVPQFYDVENSSQRKSGGGIAAPFVAAKWGPVFNRFKKRFRIGISTFGRVKYLRSPQDSTGGSAGLRLGPEAHQGELSANPVFHLETSRTDAQEIVVSYSATRPTRIGWSDFAVGEGFAYTMATQESVRAAVEQARQVKGYCGGVIFFRWPGEEDAASMRPDEALAAAGVPGIEAPSTGELRVLDGGCAAVTCTDLYLLNTVRPNPGPKFVHIDSSAPLEYFVPNERMPARMSGETRIELTIQPYMRIARGYIGRAVSAIPVTFRMTIEEGR